jgi:CheY-like chemotaxis protein
MQRNILVVEDNDVNLELLTLMIDQYAQEKEADINLLTATNGQEAVDICSKQAMDIIFMDLMMPTMNGNEATKIIKSNHPKTMVIVISAFGDEAKQKEMLRNGAEDYMIKPVSASLFKSRLHNYLQLIQTRNHISTSSMARNLFTAKVYKYHIDFFIGSEAELSEFWKALLIRLDFQRHIDNLSDFVRFIYRLGSTQLHHKFQFHIYIEEDADNFFFTLDNIKLLGCEKVDTLISSYYPEAIYLCKGNSLSFVLQKAALEESPVPKTKSEKAPAAIDFLTTKQDQELLTFDILDADELEDFEDHLLKLRSLILLMENSSLETSDIEELCHSFDEMASILTISNDTYVLSNSLHELSGAIAQNQQHFQESAGQLFDFVNAFMNDLIFWKTKIFYEGAPSVDFLNDSITANANMLNALLQPPSETAEEVDDIFDF